MPLDWKAHIPTGNPLHSTTLGQFFDDPLATISVTQYKRPFGIRNTNLGSLAAKRYGHESQMTIRMQTHAEGNYFYPALTPGPSFVAPRPTLCAACEIEPTSRVQEVDEPPDFPSEDSESDTAVQSTRTHNLSKHSWLEDTSARSRRRPRQPFQRTQGPIGAAPRTINLYPPAHRGGQHQLFDSRQHDDRHQQHRSTQQSWTPSRNSRPSWTVGSSSSHWDSSAWEGDPYQDEYERQGLYPERSSLNSRNRW